MSTQTLGALIGIRNDPKNESLPAVQSKTPLTGTPGPGGTELHDFPTNIQLDASRQAQPTSQDLESSQTRADPADALQSFSK